MLLPLTLPLNNYAARHMTLSRHPDGHRYARVLQIELLSDAEEAAVRTWLPPSHQAARIEAVQTALHVYDREWTADAFDALKQAVNALKVAP